MKNSLKQENSRSLEYSVEELLEIVFQDRVHYAAMHSAAVNHELHTPLVIIRGLAESLLKRAVQNPQKHLREIADEADHLLKILDKMVYRPPVEPFHKQNISLLEAIDQVLVFFEKVCLEQGISIRVDVDESLRVESEPNRLKSILGALIQNAVESFEDKKIGTARIITIHAQEAKDGLHLMISDTGRGISDEVQKKIVEEIFKQKNISTHSGLGLALAKKIANDLDIKMGFVSEKLHGTNFTLTFKK
jgi:signal transduction histidine kinase